MTRKELLTSDEYIIAFLDCAVRSDKSSKSIRKEVAEKWLSYRDELIEMFKPTPSVSAEDFRKQIFSHLNSLPYAGGYPGDWHETLANHLSTYFASRKPAGIRWVKDKPVNDKEFVMVTASLIKDRWDYQAWELVEIPGEGYYGLCQTREMWLSKWRDSSRVSIPCHELLPRQSSSGIMRVHGSLRSFRAH